MLLNPMPIWQIYFGYSFYGDASSQSLIPQYDDSPISVHHSVPVWVATINCYLKI